MTLALARLPVGQPEGRSQMVEILVVASIPEL